MRSFAVFALALPVLASASVLPRATCTSADQYCCTSVAQLNSGWDYFLEAMGISLNTNSTPTLGIGCGHQGNGVCYANAPTACCTGTTFTGLIGGMIFPSNCTVLGNSTTPA